MNETPITTLAGLDSGISLGGVLIIDNNQLTSLDGLSSLTSVGAHINISSNTALPDCEVCDLLDQFTTVPTTITVSDNLDDSCTPVPANCP